MLFLHGRLREGGSEVSWKVGYFVATFPGGGGGSGGSGYVLGGYFRGRGRD